MRNEMAALTELTKTLSVQGEMAAALVTVERAREIMAILNELDVPCGPIMSTGDLATDEHVRGREMYVELDHPQRGKWWNVGMPIKLSASPAVIKRSPTLGEHTEEVLKDVLGYADDKVATMKAAGAFSLPPKKVA